VFARGTELLDEQFFTNLIDAALIYIGNTYISSCKMLDTDRLIKDYKEKCELFSGQTILMEEVQKEMEEVQKEILKQTAPKSVGGYRRNKRKTRNHKKGKSKGKGKGRTHTISRKRMKRRKNKN
jgi:hypothetical protein